MDEHKHRRTYDKAFKRETVRLVLEEGRRASEVERNLGIGRSIVSRWVREFHQDAQDAFPGQGRMKPAEEQIRALQRELDCVTRERDILKKAVAIFSKDPDRYSDS